MLKERRSVGRLFFNMGLSILVRRRIYIETGPGPTGALTLEKVHEMSPVDVCIGVINS